MYSTTPPFPDPARPEAGVDGRPGHQARAAPHADLRGSLGMLGGVQIVEDLSILDLANPLTQFGGLQLAARHLLRCDGEHRLSVIELVLQPHQLALMVRTSSAKKLAEREAESICGCRRLIELDGTARCRILDARDSAPVDPDAERRAHAPGELRLAHPQPLTLLSKSTRQHRAVYGHLDLLTKQPILPI